jgi:hypothetical protein
MSHFDGQSGMVSIEAYGTTSADGSSSGHHCRLVAHVRRFRVIGIAVGITVRQIRVTSTR